jgi:ABC-2 type transport system permease protein
MKGLLVGEVTRMLARRLVRVSALLTLAAILVAAAVVFLTSRALPEADYQARVGQEARRCEQGQRPPGPLKGTPAGNDLRAVCLADARVRVRDPRFHLRSLSGILAGAAAPLVIVAWLIGASAIGAEWHSRSLTTLLTWEPRRLRVLATKLLIAGVVAFLFTVVALALLAGALAPSAFLHGTTAGTGGSWLRSLTGVIARAGALASIAALIAFSIATLGRNTSAALAAGFGYILVIENVIGGTKPTWRQWLLMGNGIIFVTGKENLGYAHDRSVLGATVILVTVAALLVLCALTAFRRRDIA